jgi:hypothetical protein
MGQRPPARLTALGPVLPAAVGEKSLSSGIQ